LHDIFAHFRHWAALAIFVATIFVMATGRLLGSRLDRTGAALLGAALMIALGVESLPEAYRAVDWNTITLLLGMMIVVAYLKVGGVFARLTDRVGRHVRQPWVLLVLIALVSAVASAFLVNDTICLVFTPLVLDLTLGLGRNPVPYLLALATAANCGSAATITGNPQNIMIGSFSGISYGRFAEALTPIAVIGVLLALLLVTLLYRREILGPALASSMAPRRQVQHRPSPWVYLVLAAMILGFFLVAPVAKPAIVAAALLLLTPGIKPYRIYREIDWSLLILFSGLFIVVAGAGKILLTPTLLAHVADLPLDRVPVLALISAGLSNLISNVPAVLVLRPFVAPLPHLETSWLTLAAASTLAGNFTILGSVANLIVVAKAAERRVTIGFWTYFKLGAPLTVLSLAAAIGLLILR
jgi:Na+/H+ antiporter NhaD/arsenite permease-like protein